MKHLKGLFTLFLVLTVTCAALSQKDVSDEIRVAEANFVKLFNAGDIDAFISVYAEDARLLPPNGPVISEREAIKEFWGGMLSAGLTVKITTVSAQGFGKTAIEEGVVEIYSGDSMVDEVKFIVVWKKIKGEWKMYQDIWNSNNPLPGQ